MNACCQCPRPAQSVGRAVLWPSRVRSHRFPWPPGRRDWLHRGRSPDTTDRHGSQQRSGSFFAPSGIHCISRVVLDHSASPCRARLSQLTRPGVGPCPACSNSEVHGSSARLRRHRRSRRRAGTGRTPWDRGGQEAWHHGNVRANAARQVQRIPPDCPRDQ